MNLRNTMIALSACGALALAACAHTDDGPSQDEYDALKGEAAAAADAQANAEQTARDAAAAKLVAEQKAQDAAAAQAVAEQKARDADAAKLVAEQRALDAENQATKVDETEQERLADQAREKAQTLFTGMSALADDIAAEQGSLRLTGAGFTGSLVGADPGPTFGASGADVSDLGDWEAGDFVASVAGTVDHVRVYSNIGDPDVQSFVQKHGLSKAPDDVGFDASLIASGDFADGSGMKTHPAVGEDTVVEVRGTYDGADGTYRCMGTCTSAVAAAGGFTLLGMWTFSPDPGAMTNTPDSSYLNFGWWLRVDPDGSMEVDTFAFPTVAVAPTGIDDLNGAATYQGGASGKYSLNDPLGGPIEAGAFTADAELQANFNTELVKGMLDGFMTDNGAKDNWSVALSMADIANEGVIAASDPAAMTTWTIGTRSAAAGGVWSGQFYNPDTTGGSVGTPADATGEFKANYDSAGFMVGAFGVSR
jgi:hypothetical protein